MKCIKIENDFNFLLSTRWCYRSFSASLEVYGQCAVVMVTGLLEVVIATVCAALVVVIRSRGTRADCRIYWVIARAEFIHIHKRKNTGSSLLRTWFILTYIRYVNFIITFVYKKYWIIRSPPNLLYYKIMLQK